MFTLLLALACTKDTADGANDTGAASDSGIDGPVDADGDGHTTETDCDDGNADVHPDASEVCDGVDNDCDELVDDDDDSLDASTGVEYFADGDGDTYGAGDALWACEAPSDSSATGDDCNDADDAVNPGADEVCNGIDDNCDDVIDTDAIDADTWYEDFDGDGYGDATRSTDACDQPSGHVDNGEDCDDADDQINPEAKEVCDGADNDCDSETDEADALDASTWYADKDGDGYGVSDVTEVACDQPSGYADNADDCDDSDSDTNPGADEYCDGHDDDCDTEVDEDDAVDVTTWYADSDGDGYGDPTSSVDACDEPRGYTDDSDDCDDTDGDVNPDADEICDGVDNDCDSSTGEDDTVAFNDGSGTTDMTSDLAGSSSSPGDYELTDDGTLTFCDGTFYVNLDISADVDIVGASGDETAVILDGAATGSVIAIETDGVSVTLDSLTIQNGLGDVETYTTSWTGGGGLACNAASSVSATNVVFDSNDGGTSSMGGGISLTECTGTFDDVTVSNNTAAYGGAFFTDEASIEFYDSTIELNAADSYGGMAYMWGDASSIGSDVYLEDTEVADNTAGSGLEVGYLYYYSTLECVGDDTVSGLGFTGADDTTYGAIYTPSSSGAEFTATDCDFDNGDSVLGWQGTLYDDLDEDSTFFCDDDGCTSYEDYELGGYVSNSSGYNVWGNTFLADTDDTIQSFQAYTQAGASGCTIDYHVLSASSSTPSSWDVEWSSTGNSVSTTAGYHSSGTVDFEVTSGTYYALLWAMDCGTAYYYFDTSATATDAGFGTAVGYVYASSYSSISGTWSGTNSTSYDAPLGMIVTSGSGDL